MALSVRGARIDWDSGGRTTAPPLVWGHGLTSSRADEDRFALVDLARVREHATVVRYDAHGHGESSTLSEPERGSWRELAIDQIELIDYLRIDDVILGGASMGAGTALHAAIALGDRVAGLVLTIPPTAWSDRSEQVAMYEQMASIVEAKGVETLVAAGKAMPPPDPFRGSEAATATYRQRRADALRAADPGRLAANLRGAGHADLPPPEQVAGIGAPTLVLAWTGDPGHPVSTANQLGELLPDVELVVSSTEAELSTWTNRVIDFLGPLVG